MKTLITAQSVGHFKINDNRGKIIYLKPELRIYNQPVIITSEADIKTTLFSDTFLVMNVVKERNILISGTRLKHL